MLGRPSALLELGVVFEHGCDEGGAHRVRRVAVIEPEIRRLFAQSPVDRIGVHVSALALLLAGEKQRAELLVSGQPASAGASIGSTAGALVRASCTGGGLRFGAPSSSPARASFSRASSASR